MEHNSQSSNTEGLVVPGLSVVLVGPRVLIGCIDPNVEMDWASVTLKDALEVLQHATPGPDGRARMSVTFLPIPPFAGPVNIEVRLDGYSKIEKDGDLSRMYANITGRVGLVTPTTPPLPNFRR